MKINSMNKLLSVILCMVLIAAMALFATGCTESGTETTPPTEGSSETTPATEAGTEGGSDSDVTVLGEGATVFTVITTDLDGVETTWEIHTDAATVGEALQAVELIEGEMGDYGLYIKTVNGVTLDYETDGKYWAVYIDGEYALIGVDSIEAAAGVTYTFKPE